MSRDSLISIAKGYVAMCWTTGVQLPEEERDFSPFRNLKIRSAAHPASYTMGTGAISPVIKRLGSEADHSTPPSTEVKNCGAIPPLPQTSSWRSA
jgi:hypothetical protein